MLSCVCRLNAVSAGWHQCWPAGLGHCTDHQLWEEQTGECKSTIDRHKPLNCTIWSEAVLLSFALRVSRWPSTVIDSLSASICDAVPWPVVSCQHIAYNLYVAYVYLLQKAPVIVP